MPVAPVDGKGSAAAVPFLVSAGIVYEIVAAACSSPQTAEINADKRAATLMKWVYLGMGQSILFVGIAVAVEPQHAGAILAGGGLAAALLWASYSHAMSAGLANPAGGTES